MNQEKREDSKAIQTSHPFQILCLDGGGIKGLFSAAILAHLEEDFHIKITDYFDLIVGTSTGGIIALALGIGLRPREIVHFYVSNGNSIFANRWPLKLRQLWHLSRHFIRNKYDSKPLEKALKDCFGDKVLAESKKRVVIPSYNIGEDDIYLFSPS